MTIEQSLVVGLFGFYIGALALPELEKNFLKNPALYQVIIGALMGLTAPYVFNASLEWFIGGIIIGVLIGYLAPYWLKGVQLPC
ncbi:MAG: hypothetical protein SVT56_07845 [Chloroflexota bacterium]|nr:hypothetical protein [Chloroflexota bacterium]